MHYFGDSADRVVFEISQRNQRTGSLVLVEYDVPNIESAPGVEYGRIAAVVRKVHGFPSLLLSSSAMSSSTSEISLSSIIFNGRFMYFEKMMRLPTGAWL